MKVKFLQEGGQAPAAPANPQGGNQPGPEEQIMQMAQQIVQQLGPEASALLAQTIMQILQGGGGAQEQAAPTYAKKGAKLVKVTKK